MGSPTTTVRVVVLREHAEMARRIIEAAGEPVYEQSEDPECTTLIFNEVSNGEIDGIDQLQAMGIAYDCQIEADWMITPGTHYCRFTEGGELQLKWIPDESLAISIDQLYAVIENHPELVQLISRRHAAIQVLPWDNQATYGKRHRLVRLTD